MTDRKDKRASIGEVLGDVGRVLAAGALTVASVALVACVAIVVGLRRPKGKRVDR